jgi:hypothetical protein
MVEYVYALHDFAPENEDEVPFRAGERIEIVSRDDEFGDGWWEVSAPPPYCAFIPSPCSPAMRLPFPPSFSTP